MKKTLFFLLILLSLSQIVIQSCSDSQNDSDGDGITDDIDQCLKTPINEVVDGLGCPLNNCPQEGTPCDDGDLNTEIDTEDGNCNCSGTPINYTAISFAAFGDYGSGSQNQANVANLVANVAPDFIITTGDNRYNVLAMDETVGQFYCDYLNNSGNGPNCEGGNSQTNSFFPSTGNHDYTDGGGINEYQSYFELPGTGVSTSGTSSSELYYDFVIGPVHFFTIDSYATLNSPTEKIIQKNWLQEQLAASAVAWKIVYFHHAPFSSADRHGSDPQMQWPFNIWGADAVIAGHDHTYERLQIGGIPYFVTGLGGLSVRNFGTPVAGSQVRYNGDFGSMFGEATNTSLIFRFINVQGELIDTYKIQK
ncbi:metallophosphoesterase [bacterium]|nr:metallophosphoesterase [bacterium]